MCLILLLKKILQKIIDFLCLLFCCNDCTGSGSGSYSNKYKKIKLIRKLDDDIIGKGFHRSGWYSVMKYLSIYDSEDGILFDDFIEQNFCYNPNPEIYRKPWVGVFHHPPCPPFFSNEKEKMSNYLSSNEFLESSKNLKLAIVLTQYQKDFLEKYIKCPIVVIKHPCEDSFDNWSFEKWGKDKKLVQIGFYLRNTQLIYQIPDIIGVKKIRLWNNSKWITSYDETVKNYWNVIKKRENIGKARNMSFQTPSSYDKILSSGVVVTEAFDLAASNVVLDCIVRNTPLIINRCPAAEEYLGKDYPLFFEDPLEIPNLLEKVEDAHEYLCKMDKSDIKMENFVSKVIKGINEL
jgi:hypothetical protein